MATTINNHKTSEFEWKLGGKREMENFLPPLNEVKIVFRWVLENADYRDAENLQRHCGQQVEVVEGSFDV